MVKLINIIKEEIEINEQELIQIVKGTSSLYDDVKNLYVREFDNARIEYNENGTITVSP